MLGYKKTGDEHVANVICESYTGSTGAIWVWNNIVLKSETNILSKTNTIEATKSITDI